MIRIIAIAFVACLLAGCNGDARHCADVSLLAANAYEAAKAADQGVDLHKTTTAIRLLCEKIANMHGQTIQGFKEWVEQSGAAK